MAPLCGAAGESQAQEENAERTADHAEMRRRGGRRRRAQIGECRRAQHAAPLQGKRPRGEMKFGEAASPPLFLLSCRNLRQSAQSVDRLCRQPLPRPAVLRRAIPRFVQVRIVRRAAVRAVRAAAELAVLEMDFRGELDAGDGLRRQHEEAVGQPHPHR